MTSSNATPTPAPATFTEQQVLDALNDAANDILDAVDAGDEGLRDGINLMVNATIAYLRGEAADLHEVAEGSYGEDLDTILGLDRGGDVMTWWDEQHDERRAALTEALNSERGRRYLDYAGGSLGFAAWLLVADRACVRSLGVSIFDLSDWAWRDAYDAGDPPGAAVREAVAAVAADDTFGTLLGGA